MNTNNSIADPKVTSSAPGNIKAENPMAQINIKKLIDSLREITPKAGSVFAEKGELKEILCKPKILPLKSLTLLKLEQMEQNLTLNSKLNP